MITIDDSSVHSMNLDDNKKEKKSKKVQNLSLNHLIFHRNTKKNEKDQDLQVVKTYLLKVTPKRVTKIPIYKI